MSNQYANREVAKSWESRQLTSRGGYADFQERLHFLSNWGRITKESPTLSIGAGTGTHEQFIDCDGMVCLDITREMLEIAVAKGQTCVQGTAFNLPFEDGKFDCTFAIDLSVFHYPRDRLAGIFNIDLSAFQDTREMLAGALAEMARVTKKGGRVITMTRNELQNKLVSFILHLNPDFDTYRVRQSSIRRAFRDSGLQIENNINAGYPRIHSQRLDTLLAKLHLDFLGHWFICCGVKE
ncbi:class I SAM-dependent methyltransferase [Chloroflexota bacterium]